MDKRTRCPVHGVHDEEFRDPATKRPLADPPYVADAMEFECCRLTGALADELREEKREHVRVFLRRRRPDDED